MDGENNPKPKDNKGRAKEIGLEKNENISEKATLINLLTLIKL